MKCFQGKSVYKGMALGKISVLKKEANVVKRSEAEESRGRIKES